MISDKRTLILILVLIFSSCQKPIEYTAVVVSAHQLASGIGKNILVSGGNAFDAAVAVHFALQVVYPVAGNIGGGGFAVIRTKEGKSTTLDFREKAPMLAHEDMYLRADSSVDSNKSRIGHLAAGVPGSVEGMWQIHQKYGTLPWEELLNPSIELCKEGYLISFLNAKKLNNKQEDFKNANIGYQPWIINENGWDQGDLITQPYLAAVLTRIAKQGKEGFYDGETADLIVREMNKANGLISHEDLKAYKAVWRKPLIGKYRGYKVVSMPPPSSGGVALIQLLKGAEMHDLHKYPHNSIESIHLKTELERRVYADRATFLGDPDHYEIPTDRLISDDYIENRFQDISMSHKTDSKKIKDGKVDIIESMETTHYSIVDEQGNGIAVTTTLNGAYGCKVMVEGAGFLLNNEMDDFSAKPGTPNQFGLIGAEANAIAPEKRMLSSMTPTILEEDGKLFMITGTPGGSTIITSVFQSILNVIDHRMSMQESVNSKKVHSQWLPDSIYFEPDGLPQDVINGLKELGHGISKNNRKLGRIDAILVKPNGKLEGAADPRGEDSAEGY